MSDLSVKEIERLLAEAGVAVPPPTAAGKGRPQSAQRAWFGRFVRRLKVRMLVVACLALLVIVGQFRWLTATAGDPWGAQATDTDPRFGAVEAFSAPEAATVVGVRWERIAFWWKDIQPSGPDSWTLAGTVQDRALSRELEAGRQVAGLLIKTPDWAAANPARHSASPPSGLYLPFDDARNTWGRFVARIAQTYANRIDTWIIWNEVTIRSGQWYTWGGSRADYAQLVKVAYLAAKSTNPNAHIVLAGDPYWYDHGAAFADLLARFHGDPQAPANNDYFDAVNLHLYSRPTDQARIVTEYRAAMARFGLHKPIWIGETNATPYNDTVRPLSRGNVHVTTDDQASFIVESFATALAMGVERIEVYRMLDGGDFEKGGDPQGLVRNDGTVRPAFYAFRTVSNLFSHVLRGSLQVDARTGACTVTLHKVGSTVTVLWDQGTMPATVTLPAISPRAASYDKFGQRTTLVAHDNSYTLQLAAPPAPINDPRYFVTGGNPVIVVQPG